MGKNDYIDKWLMFFEFYNPNTTEKRKNEILRSLKGNKFKQKLKTNKKKEGKRWKKKH